MLPTSRGRLVQAVDPVNGGIRGAPKFPQPQFFQFLWRAGLRFGLPHPLEAVDLTLTQIAQGGIYDHLGGGFARYSVDEKWLVPHFEKMLYDNAQLVEMMTQAWREKKSPLYAQRIEETIGWLHARDGRRTAAASPRRSTPTARARRGSSMCGVSPRSRTRSAPTTRNCSPRSTA